MIDPDAESRTFAWSEVAQAWMRTTPETQNHERVDQHTLGNL